MKTVKRNCLNWKGGYVSLTRHLNLFKFSRQNTGATVALEWLVQLRITTLRGAPSLHWNCERRKKTSFSHRNDTQGLLSNHGTISQQTTWKIECLVEFCLNSCSTSGCVYELMRVCKLRHFSIHVHVILASTLIGRSPTELCKSTIQL